MALFRLREGFDERRKSPRQEAHYLAQLDVGDPMSLLSCIISDISARGAKLTIASQQALPDEFTLLLRRRCRVVRRGDGQVGVEFV